VGVTVIDGANVSAEDDDKSAEARRAMRIRTFLQARISYGDGAMSIACTVNQLSDTGARITLPTSCALPELFDLAIPQRGVVRKAKFVWRKDDQLGVDFLDTDESHAATAPGDPHARIKVLEAENARLRAQIGALTLQLHRLTDD
jgi:hypothetical protein